ncbi:beta-galactosidase [Mycolicibacterium madagascariense]|nr:beta-galactosidase [Mycolicibacterium madagascariense]MCV7015270.1 cellulase family glycosylhydrolase [Mycolicibacterium madagascariense]
MYAISARSARSAATRLLVATVATATVCTHCAALRNPPVQSSAAVAYTASIVDSASTIGIADSDLYGESVADIDTTLDTLESLGVTSIRVFVPWALIEPAEGTYNWTYIDEVMAAAAARNMSVLAGVTSTPTWDAPSGTILGAGTPNPTDYAAFLTQVAERYGNEISAYEIWNEPNSVASYDPIDPATYTALLKAGYTAIKAVDPSASVIAAGLGSVVSFGNLTLDPVTFVQEMLADGASGYFDALAFHPYETSLEFSAGAGVANSPLTQIEAIEAMLVAAGDPTKIWITEYGVQTSDVSQQTQANYIQDLIDTWETLTYAGPVYIYTAQDGVDGTYGIYEADWTPKLAVAVLAAEIAKYATTVVTTTITTPIAAAAQQMAAFVQSVSKAVAAMGQQISATVTAAAQALAHLGQQISQAITKAFTALAATFEKAASSKATSTSTANATTKAASAAVDAAPATVTASVVKASVVTASATTTDDAKSGTTTGDAKSGVEKSVVRKTTATTPTATAATATATTTEPSTTTAAAATEPSTTDAATPTRPAHTATKGTHPGHPDAATPATPSASAAAAKPTGKHRSSSAHAATSATSAKADS